MSPAIAKARAFLKAFARCGNITQAAEAAGIERTNHYRWMRVPKYAAAFAKAEQEFADVLEAEAIRRANEGVLEPVFYQGAACGAIRKYSDGLMLGLLKRFKPERYGTRVTAEVSGPGGGPIPVHDAALAKLTDDELEQLIAVARKLGDADH